MIDAKEMAIALARIANGDVPLDNYGDMIQAVQRYAFDVLDDMGVEVDAAEIEAEWV